MKYGGKVQVVAGFLFAVRILFSLGLIAFGVLCLVAQDSMFHFLTDLGFSITLNRTLFAGIVLMAAGLAVFIRGLCHYIILAGVGEMIENSGYTARELRTVSKSVKRRSYYEDDDTDDEEDDDE